MEEVKEHGSLVRYGCLSKDRGSGVFVVQDKHRDVGEEGAEREGWKERAEWWRLYSFSSLTTPPL